MKHKITMMLFSLLMIMLLAAACSKKSDEASADIDITQNNPEDDSLTSDITPSVTTSAETGESVTQVVAADTLTSEPDSSDEDNITPTSPASSEGTTVTPASPVSSEKPIITPTSAVPAKAPVVTPTSAPAKTGKPASPTKVPKPDTATPTPASSGTEQDSGSKDVKIIAIDAGHQSKGNYEEEPIGPGATETKPKVSSGTQGAYTGVPEYKLTLVIAKKVKDALIDRGYQVVMIRETNNVNISNKERAEIANESGADLFIRIHADGSDNHNVNGVSTLYPSKNNPYVPQLYKNSYNLSKLIVDSICDSTGAKNRGAVARDDMSGINWCTLPVTIIEMGYMTNKTEDKLMQTEDYQEQIVQGICDGIDKYFE
jgi:N-acetylmuramoyl-L-alanine amidase